MLPGGEDWALRPVLRGLMKYESLLDGTVDIADVALLNDALDIADYNSAKIAEAQERAANG